MEVAVRISYKIKEGVDMYIYSITKKDDGMGTPSCRTPQEAARIFRDIVPEDEPRECLVTITLNGSTEATGVFLASIGGTGSVTIDSRVICRLAISSLASGIIIVHSHPTGKARPSSHDIAETEGLRAACKTIGIPLIDHVIVAEDGIYSFANEKKYDYTNN